MQHALQVRQLNYINRLKIRIGTCCIAWLRESCQARLLAGASMSLMSDVYSKRVTVVRSPDKDDGKQLATPGEVASFSPS